MNVFFQGLLMLIAILVVIFFAANRFETYFQKSLQHRHSSDPTNSLVSE